MNRATGEALRCGCWYGNPHHPASFKQPGDRCGDRAYGRQLGLKPSDTPPCSGIVAWCATASEAKQQGNL